MAQHSNHALRMASASHLAAHGDISGKERDRIHARARKAIGASKKKAPPPPRAFGSLAPPPAPAMGPLPAMGAGHYMGTTPTGSEE